jgi:multiple sugar transport system substrate-binding protein
MALTPMATLGMFFTLCNYFGEEPFKNQNTKVVSDGIATLVLDYMRSLFGYMPSWCLNVYPPEIFNKMCTSSELWFVPLTYGYVNYSMKGYTDNPITFMNVPITQNNVIGGSTLGGVGIALSAHCQNIETALNYMKWIACANCQSTLYAFSGGQPSNKEAWKSDYLNAITNKFYENTIASVENAFVRPRYDGFHHFQTNTGRLLQSFLKNEYSISDTIKTVNLNYLNSIK